MHKDKQTAINALNEAIAQLDKQEQAQRVLISETAVKYQNQIPQQWYVDQEKEMHAIQYASSFLRQLRNTLDTTYKPLTHYKLFIKND